MSYLYSWLKDVLDDSAIALVQKLLSSEIDVENLDIEGEAIAI